MIAEQIDPDLNQNHQCMFNGSVADRIQNNFITAWTDPINPGVLLGLAWAYGDCDYEYAAKEASFLWELTVWLP